MTDEDAPLVGKRATVAFTARAAIDLDWLVERTGLKQVDVVNRAVQIYALIEEAKSSDKFLLFGQEVTETRKASPLAKVLGCKGEKNRIAVERINIV